MVRQLLIFCRLKSSRVLKKKFTGELMTIKDAGFFILITASDTLFVEFCMTSQTSTKLKFQDNYDFYTDGELLINFSRNG